MDPAQLQPIVNWIFPGLTLYYRDTPLTPEQLALYRPDQILRNNFFVDVSSLAGGLAGTTRYAIASAHAAPLYEVNPALAKWRQHTLLANNFFKVLDVYNVAGKTQVLLLHIPRAYLRDIAPNTALEPMEPQVVQMARASFDQKLQLTPIAELQEPEWLNRVQLPLGLDPNNQLVKLDEPFTLPADVQPLYDAIAKMTGDTTGLNA